MKETKLSTLPDDSKFYRGTIITIKDAEITPKGNFDKKYCMVMAAGGMSDRFSMLDLYRSMGSCIIHDLKPNIRGHVAVDKKGIFDWVDAYFKLFYTPEGYDMWKAKIEDIVYVSDLNDVFTQANRDLFM
jgi:hypothetical protein